ncbi:MAG: GNAT family N-acetyltransferase [Peptococcales bacterium]|jgi:GNAT superfamily N-acetyltransferase
MTIIYKNDLKIQKEQLVDLFSSVQWESSKHPERLQSAIANSHSVITAWDDKKLVGLINALSDGAMTVYFHYMLVDPDYQGNGIGKKLLQLMLEKYKDFPTKVLISYEQATDFYIKHGFKAEEGTTPLFITELV